MRSILVLCTMVTCVAAIAHAQEKSTPPAGPPVVIVLGSRHGHATPLRQGFAHTGGGNIDVAQPSPDTLVVTMTGVAVAGAHPCKDSVAAWSFDLEQCFEVRFEDEKRKQAKLTLEARVIGVLRSHCKGGGVAEQGPGCATVTGGPVALLTVCAPPHSVSGGENLSVNCKEGPVGGPAGPGVYTLHQTFGVRATHPHSLAPCKAASAEFAPDPALDPLWISYWEPFHGAAKKDFGLQVIMRVAADAPPNGK
jgi:hypothetical protein